MTPFTTTTHEAATIARAGIGSTVAIVRRLPKAHPKFPNLNQIRMDVLVFNPENPEAWYWDGVYDRVGASYAIPLSPGRPVWVREAHYLTDDGEEECVVYAEDKSAVDLHFNGIRLMQVAHSLTDEWAAPHLRLRQSGWMPSWASRFTLTPETVRVCRLSEVTDDELNSTKVAPHPLKDAPADTWVMVALCKIGGVE